MRPVALAALAILSLAPLARADDKPAPLAKEREVSLPGDGSWDYVAPDPSGERVFVAHATRVDVIDTKTWAKVGEVPGVDGAHGTAFAPEAKRGFATAGRKNKVIAFELDTLKVLKEIDTGNGPDAVIFVASAGEVWTMNHKGGTITCVDPKTLEAKATIEIGGTLETPAEDVAKGLVYVNVEDKHTVVTVDAKKHAVVATHPLAPGEGPAGLAFDAKDGLLFVGCGNSKLVVLEAESGKVVAALDIGEHCDGCAFDPGARIVIASARGKTAAFHVKDATTLEPLPPLEAGKTCGVDAKTHRFFITTGKRGEKDSVKVLVYGPAAPGAF